MKKYIVLCLILILSSCSESERVTVVKQKRKTTDKILKDVAGNSNFNKICLEGHTYWYRSSGHATAFAIKLDDDGKPIKCKEK